MASLDVLNAGEVSEKITFSQNSQPQTIDASKGQAFVLTADPDMSVLMVESGTSMLIYTSQDAEAPLLRLDNYFSQPDNEFYVNEDGNYFVLNGEQIVPTTPEITHMLAGAMHGDMGSTLADNSSSEMDDSASHHAGSHEFSNILPFAIFGAGVLGGILTTAHDDSDNSADPALATKEDTGISHTSTAPTSITAQTIDLDAAHLQGQGSDGADQFILHELPQHSRFTISDFNADQDVIELSAKTFSALEAGKTPELSIDGSNPDAPLQFNSQSGVLSYDADGHGGAAALHIATLTGLDLEHLSASNIHIIA